MVRPGALRDEVGAHPFRPAAVNTGSRDTSSGCTGGQSKQAAVQRVSRETSGGINGHPKLVVAQANYCETSSDTYEQPRYKRRYRRAAERKRRYEDAAETSGGCTGWQPKLAVA